MKVIELLEENYFICHNKDVLFKEVHSIKTFHEEVEEGDIFIALRGENFDGNDFIWQAYERGAVCVISDEEGKGDIEVKNARQTYSLLSKNFFDKACDKLKIIAITGTNGKTTTCNIVADLLRSFGKKVGVIGTLGVKIDGDFEYNGFTTPDPFLLHKTFFKMAQMGLEYVVMEASAHAIYLDKLDYIKFEIVAFTNFTQDHLDYFGDMKRYFQAKLKIFNKNNVKLAIVANKIDKIDKILKQKGVKYLTFGLNGDCDYKGEIIENSLLGSHFICQNGDKVFDIKSNFIGSFNVENLLCGFAICHNLALDERLLTKNISSLMPPLGRCNILKGQSCFVIIDFAHTPDGIEKILSSVKQLCEKIVVVFGCGGNRDKTKRSIMGKIASEKANMVILTSDNPRWERPKKIIADIQQGIEKNNYKIIVNRKKAIKYAIKHFKNGYAIIIAGKGGENYQEKRGKKKNFSDFEIVRKYLK